MKNNRRYFIFCLLLLTFLQSVPAVADQLLQLQSPPFTIRYDARDTHLAREISYRLVGSWQRVQGELPVMLPERPVVRIAPSADDFYRVARGSVPHWGAALALSSLNMILLKSNRWASVNNDWSSLLSHELAHLAVYTLSKGFPVPTWLGEGIAVAVSGEVDITRRSEVARALLTGRIFSLNELERLHSMSGNEARLAYTEAVLAVNYFRERFGRSAVVLLLNQLAQGQSYERAFHTTTGEQPDRFEDKWRRHLWGHYFYYILLGINSWIWGFILVLVIVAIIIVRRRNRRTIRRWEQEEPWEAESDFDPFDW
ncbi:MAG: hypothetical protein ISR91_00580 [Candidatus Delongbacteria bacterium]|nr:hypothetical protein [Candidatus Delongbacteria bacterium]